MNNNGNGLSIKEQIISNIEILSTLKPVAEVSIKVFIDFTFNQIRDYLYDFYKKINYQIDRMNFGQVVIDKKRINESLDYLMTDDELAAHLAIPSVLKRGILIGMHENHKGRKIETITIAAPVLIDGRKCFVAAVVKRTNKNYYKVHRVVCADDFALKIKTRISKDNRKQNLR